MLKYLHISYIFAIFVVIKSISVHNHSFLNTNSHGRIYSYIHASAFYYNHPLLHRGRHLLRGVLYLCLYRHGHPSALSVVSPSEGERLLTSYRLTFGLYFSSKVQPKVLNAKVLDCFFPLVKIVYCLGFSLRELPIINEKTANFP